MAVSLEGLDLDEIKDCFGKTVSKDQVANRTVSASDTKGIKVCVDMLKELYDISECHIETHLKQIIGEGWSVWLFSCNKEKDCGLVIAKPCYRMHCGSVFIIDSIVSKCTTMKMGSYIIDFCFDQAVNNDCFGGLQLDCKLENSDAQEFYKRVMLKERAISFVSGPFI